MQVNPHWRCFVSLQHERTDTADAQITHLLPVLCLPIWFIASLTYPPRMNCILHTNGLCPNTHRKFHYLKCLLTLPPPIHQNCCCLLKPPHLDPLAGPLLTLYISVSKSSNSFNLVTFLRNLKKSGGDVPSIIALGRQRQAHLYEFETSLIYTVSYRLAKATQRTLFWNTNKQTNKQVWHFYRAPLPALYSRDMLFGFVWSP